MKTITFLDSTIYGVCFSNDNPELIYVVVLNFTTSSIYLNLVNITNNKKINSSNTNIIGETIDKVICKSNKIFINTNKKLYIYSHNSSLILLWKYTYGILIIQTILFDMSVN